MKAPVVDYRRFRLSKLRSPEFSHLQYLWGWVGYFSMYFITEALIPAERCTPIHCGLDDVIPFCEWFIIPYFLWYLLVAGSLLYFALYNVDSFKKLSTYIIITQIAAMAIYILLPSRQDLRPAEFPRDNVLTQLIGFLYSFDTSTNVCPSLHVAYSLGIASTWVREKDVCKLFKAFIVVFVLLVCMSTAFVKQHSVLDALAALPICLFAEWFVFFRKRRK